MAKKVSPFWFGWAAIMSVEFLLPPQTYHGKYKGKIHGHKIK
jgi:hypothetical protein